MVAPKQQSPKSKTSGNYKLRVRPTSVDSLYQTPMDRTQPLIDKRGAPTVLQKTEDLVGIKYRDGWWVPMAD